MKLVALTGAGISVASGLPTFAEGYWRGRPVRDLLSKTYFLSHPETFYEYFWEALQPWRKARPNPAHLALAEANVEIITQNIDGLHQAAGSSDVIEMHGNLREFVCERCGALENVDDWPAAGVPRCRHDDSILKPNVVLFEETPFGWDEAVARVLGADQLLVIGTSLEVAPACYLPYIAQRQRIPVRIINQSAETEVPRLLQQLKAL
jgi:NAD-dependent deacetylase